jgi:hypothetical protein
MNAAPQMTLRVQMTTSEFFDRLQTFGAKLEKRGLPACRVTEMPAGRLATLESKQRTRFVTVAYNAVANDVMAIFGPEYAEPIDINSTAGVTRALRKIRRYLLWEET